MFLGFLGKLWAVADSKLKYHANGMKVLRGETLEVVKEIVKT